MRIMGARYRRVSWLMAEKSFTGLVGWLASLMGAIPVSRAQDISRPGQGTVYLPDPGNKPLTLRGKGSNFTAAQFTIGGAVHLPAIHGKSERLGIAEIHGPEELVMKKPPTSEAALQQLIAGVEYRVTPYVDQTHVYNAVYNSLDSGGCVGIFPEGGSHDRPEMLPLKGHSP